MGKETEVAVRCSTVVHSRHSPDTLRDPLGFETRFYTGEGNWDVVWNLEPVLFIPDAIQFPDMEHAFKPTTKTRRQESNRILDFLSFHPERLHMKKFLLVYADIPRNYETIYGAGVQTFGMINYAGTKTYAEKFKH